MENYSSQGVDEIQYLCLQVSKMKPPQCQKCGSHFKNCVKNDTIFTTKKI